VSRYQQRQLCASPSSSSSTENEVLKGAAEVVRAHSVYERIDRRVAVTEPEGYRKNYRRCTVSAEGSQEVHCEERRPAQNETSNYYTNRFGCLKE